MLEASLLISNKSQQQTYTGISSDKLAGCRRLVTIHVINVPTYSKSKHDRLCRECEGGIVLSQAKEWQFI
ncbi:hypothetical protein ACTXT7_005230 [Hymenolepis weldensis]